MNDVRTNPERLGRITGTDAPKILGLSPWGSAIEVQERILHGVLPELDSEDTRRGKHLEAGVIAWHAEETGRVALPGRFAPHLTLDWLGASNDGFLLPPGGEMLHEPGVRPTNLEVKCPRRIDADWGEAGTDEIPDQYFVQVVVEMACHQLEETHVLLLAWGSLRCYVVRRDPAIEGELLARLSDWYERHIVRAEPLPVDASPAWDGVAKRLSAGRKDSIPASLEIQRAADRILELRAQAAVLEAEEQRERNIVEMALATAGADSVVDPRNRWSMTWREAKGASRIDAKALIDHCAIDKSIVERFTKTGEPTRRFVLKHKEDK